MDREGSYFPKILEPLGDIILHSRLGTLKSVLIVLHSKVNVEFEGDEGYKDDYYEEKGCIVEVETKRLYENLRVMSFVDDLWNRRGLKFGIDMVPEVKQVSVEEFRELYSGY